ncbi:MAG: hypothetical protein WCE45_02850 [Sedimentisphaerales bacterium]
MKFIPPKFSKLSDMASIDVGRLTEDLDLRTLRLSSIAPLKKEVCSKTPNETTFLLPAVGWIS